MHQQLDPKEWPSIRFKGEELPQSVSGISILIDRDLSEKTKDWVWRLPICKEVWKETIDYPETVIDPVITEVRHKQERIP